MLPFLYRLTFAVGAVAGGVTCIWLSLTSVPAAYAVMACFGVSAVGAIVALARSARRHLFTAPQSPQDRSASADDKTPNRAPARNR